MLADTRQAPMNIQLGKNSGQPVQCGPKVSGSDSHCQLWLTAGFLPGPKITEVRTKALTGTTKCRTHTYSYNFCTHGCKWQAAKTEQLEVKETPRTQTTTQTFAALQCSPLSTQPQVDGAQQHSQHNTEGEACCVVGWVAPVAGQPAGHQHSKLGPGRRCKGPVKVQRLGPRGWVGQLLHQCIIVPASRIAFL